MHITQRDAVTPYVTKDSSLIREIVHPQHSPARNQSLAEATVLPGCVTEAHLHTRSEEIYYILQGRGEINVEGETSTLTKGDAVVIAHGARHQIRNSGKDDLVFLCCCAPAYSHEDTTLCPALFC
ncbi:MAG TPA: cupin domain-containing protein [Abditibacteriaceae bacterium]|jgi:mannose-6-phosphate isomerase-like protein (cupin superfamily)